MTRITRHPQLWSSALWGMCHIPPNGDLSTLILFGGLTVLALGGMVHIDRRRRRQQDDKWLAIAETTSTIPFAAIIGGRNKLVLKELIVPVFAGVAVFAGVLYFHELVIGKSPFPY